MLKLKKLSDSEIAGQLFFISIRADEYRTQDRREKLFRRHFKKYPPGGVFIQRGTAEQVFSLAQWLQKISKVPLWIAADIERGVGGVFNGGTAFPHFASFGSIDDPAKTYDAGKVVGKECKAIGINLVFAPVVDLISSNPVINIRAIHESPEKVIVHARAFLAGLEEEGIHGVLKHFPGHGQFEQDSHLTGESLRVPPDSDAPHLSPFLEIAASEKNVSIMVAHAMWNRKLLCFQEPVLHNFAARTNSSILWITDDMQMKAFQDGLSQFDDNPAQHIIQSPVHHWLNPDPHQLMASQIETLIRRDPNLKERISGKVQTILTFKKKWIGNRVQNYRFQRLPKYLRRNEYLGLSHEIGRRSIICLKETGREMPEENEKILHIIGTSFTDRNATLETFRQQLNSYYKHYTETFIEEKKSKRNIRKIFSVYQRVFGGVSISSFIPDALEKWLPDVSEQDFLIFWGNIFPFRELIDRFPGTVFWVPSYMHMSQVSMFEALIGKHPVEGRLPATLSEHYRAGHGVTLPANIREPEFNGRKDDALDHYLSNLIKNQVVTGVIVGHYTGEQVEIWKAGRPKNNRLQPIPVDESIHFDVASLTKILVTTPLILHLISENKIQLDQKLSFFYSLLPDEKKSVTIHHLLTHSAGFKAWMPLYKCAETNEEAIEKILEEPLEFRPGEKIVYSDPGFILLGDIIEKVTDKSLREAFRDMITRPLGLEEDLFFPSERRMKRNSWVCSHSGWKPNHRPMDFIDDENARLFPNGAGHAGLLANVKGIIRWIDWIWAGGKWFDEKIIDPEILKFSFKKKLFIGKTGRAPGWDIPTRPSQAGKMYENQSSYGHLGFTGCALWFDIRKKRATILLTNRTFTGYPADQFKSIRRKIFNLVADLMNK
jgi:beta-glucosidase-like glycosyl hydrolase/CubicO group peptidase (beta-lactamase class C family)